MLSLLVVFFLPVRYFSGSVMKDHSSIEVSVVQERKRDPLPNSCDNRICLEGKAHCCCGHRRIPLNKQLFEKDTSFFQVKFLKSWENQAVLPHLQLLKYMWSQEGSFLCWTVTLLFCFFEYCKAILV